MKRYFSVYSKLNDSIRKTLKIFHYLIGIYRIEIGYRYVKLCMPSILFTIAYGAFNFPPASYARYENLRPPCHKSRYEAVSKIHVPRQRHSIYLEYPRHINIHVTTAVATPAYCSLWLHTLCITKMSCFHVYCFPWSHHSHVIVFRKCNENERSIGYYQTMSPSRYLLTESYLYRICARISKK